MPTLLIIHEFVFMPSISSFCLFVGIRVDYGPKFRDFVPKFKTILIILLPFFLSILWKIWEIRTKSGCSPDFILFLPNFPIFSWFYNFSPIYPNFFSRYSDFSDFFFWFSPKICPEFIPNSEWIFSHKQPWFELIFYWF